MKQGARYQGLNKKIRSEFGSRSKRFPLAFYYLETEIRLHLVASSDLGYHEAVNRNLKKYSKLNLKKLIYTQAYIFFLSIFELLPIYRNKSGVFVSISRQSDLEKELLEQIHASGAAALRNPRSLSEVSLFLRYCPLGDIAFTSLKNFKIFRRLKAKGIVRFVHDDVDMELLESTMQFSIDRTKKILLYLGVTAVILQNEHSPYEKIILLACKELEIKVAVIAHGYIQDHYLITIAPINADILMVWTVDEFDFLSKHLPKKEKDKLRYYGWPFRKIARMDIDKRSPLFVLTDVNFLSDDEFDETLRCISDLQQSFPNLRIRPHPSFYSGKSMKMVAIFQLFSDKISERTIEQDLSLSSFVIGNDTSVLVSAAQSGIASFQLNCSLRNRLPGVKPVESHLDVLGNLSYEGSIRTDSSSGHDHLKDVATQILRQLNG